MKIIKILVVALFVCAFSVQGSIKVSAGMSCDTVVTDAGTGHYLVSTPADLLAMSCNIMTGDADYRNGVYELQNDIDLSGVSWAPIGTAIYPFMGEFDGNNHKITHLTLNQLVNHGGTYIIFELYATGMFGDVEGGIIMDLTLEDPTITVATNVLASEQTRIERLSFVGVVAGSIDAESTIDSVTVKNALIDVTNTSKMAETEYSWVYTYVGGIAGRIADASIISHSEFTGVIDVSIQAEDSQNVYIGGLTGGAEESEISHSWFDGDITFTSPAEYEFAELAIGGAAGYVFMSEVSDMVINSKIDVSSDTLYAAIGGVAGTIDVLTGILRSTFKGELDSTTNNVGGLVGFIQDTAIEPNAITPQAAYTAMIDTNNVLATITGHNAVGGLVGKMYYNADIMNSWFEGNITGHHDVGGLIGTAMECRITLKTSFSLGTLSGNNNLGGIIGEGYSENDLRDVFSRMVITRIEETESVPTDLPSIYVGGIIGYDYGYFTYLEDVYFAGHFHNNTSDTVIFDPIAYSLYEPELGTGVYYDHDLSAVLSEIGTPKTTAEMKLQASYDGFNFVDTWFVDPRFNEGYAFFDAGFFRVIIDNGTAPYGYLVRFLESLVPPTAPIKTGFVFGGWFIDPQLTHAWNFSSDLVEEDVILYAKWTAQIPDTGEAANVGFSVLCLSLILLAITKKAKQ